MLQAFEVATVLVPVMLVVWMVGRLLLRGSGQVLLCMECEQCMGACPLVAKRGAGFPGPRGIMVAAKTGRVEPAVAAGALECNGCDACRKICPRGLAPQLEVDRWRADRAPPGREGAAG